VTLPDPPDILLVTENRLHMKVTGIKRGLADRLAVLSILTMSAANLAGEQVDSAPKKENRKNVPKISQRCIYINE